MKKILASFDTHSQGYSSRKLTAFAFVIAAFYLHYKYVDFSNAVEMLIVDACVIVLCLGIVTAQQVIRFKHGNKDNSDTADTSI